MLRVAVVELSDVYGDSDWDTNQSERCTDEVCGGFVLCGRGCCGGNCWTDIRLSVRRKASDALSARIRICEALRRRGVLGRELDGCRVA